MKKSHVTILLEPVENCVDKSSEIQTKPNIGEFVLNRIYDDGVCFYYSWACICWNGMRFVAVTVLIA